MTLVSTQTIGSGDGYVETTVSQLHTARIFGFSQADVDQNYSSVEFGLHLEDSSNTIYVIESGTVRGTFGTYAVGDKMRVSIESGVVKYKKNGATFYTSTVTPNYPLIVDTALYSNGATLTGVVMASSAQNVSWTNTVGVTASGSNLTKTAAAGWGNAGAVSNQTITSGDGYVETTVGQTGNARIFGFSDSDADQNYTSVDFGLHMEDNNPNLWVYESGTSRGVVGTYAVGDKLRVTIEGGVVKYRKNGALLHTSTVTPTYPLLVDTALHTNGATLSNVVFGNGSGGSSANVKWLVNDHLGTPRMVFDQTGTLTVTDGNGNYVSGMTRHDYLPFGEELFGGPPSLPGVGGRTTTMGYTASDNVRQKFTSKERDNETGLDYFLARYYSSTQGRFSGVDPAAIARKTLSNPQDFNRYSYVANNPLIFIDPNGEEKVRVMIETFIPARDVTVMRHTFKGDYDDKGNRIEGSYRTQQVIVVETDRTKNGGNVEYEKTRDTGRTYELDKPGGSPIADEKASGDTLIADTYRDNLGVHITASGNERNPLITSPAITGKYTIHLQSDGPEAKLRVGYTAEHDPFPAHRITVTRVDSGNTTTQVYLFDPRTKGYTPWSLNPLQTNERRAGVIWVDPKKK